MFFVIISGRGSSGRGSSSGSGVVSSSGLKGQLQAVDAIHQHNTTTVGSTLPTSRHGGD